MTLGWNPGVADEQKTRYKELFAQIGAGAYEREQTHTLPHDQLRSLIDSGYSALLVPEEFGGGGASVSETIELLAELARYDSNLAHIFRAQLATTDAAITGGSTAENKAVLQEIADGAFYGSAILERSAAAVGTLATTLEPVEDGYLLTGRKFYSTSALFASKLKVLAQLVDENNEPALVSITVDADSPGIELIDDWTGFGQQLTGSGSTVFDRVQVPADAVAESGAGITGHGGALLQLILLAVIDGITRNVVDDAVAFVARRNRTFSNAAASRPTDDPIIQEIIGELVSKSFAVSSVVHAAARILDDSVQVHRQGEPGAIAEAVQRAEFAAANAQLVVIDNALRAATQLFDVGGASALDSSRGLDRHWRNIRTIASHNPHRNKARLIGHQVLNGAQLENNFLAGNIGSAPDNSSQNDRTQDS